MTRTMSLLLVRQRFPLLHPKFYETYPPNQDTPTKSSTSNRTSSRTGTSSPTLKNPPSTVALSARSSHSSPSTSAPSSSAPHHTLFVACIPRDVGTAPAHDTIPERFEVVGADIAAKILHKHDSFETVVREALLVMTLHTSPGLAERLGRQGSRREAGCAGGFHVVSAAKPKMLLRGAETSNMIRWKLPRSEIEKDLGDAVVRQAMIDCKHKAPVGSWAGYLVELPMRRRKEEGEEEEEGVNRGYEDGIW